MILTSDASYLLLLYVVIPVWLIAGSLDWFMHRRDHIELTSGIRESVLHLLFLVEVGVPLTLVLTIGISSITLLLFFLGCLAHSYTFYIDTRVAFTTRTIRPLEQSIHGYLEVLPYTAFILLAATHWDGLIAEEYTPSATYLAILGIAAFSLGILPFTEEALRCKRRSSIN